MPTMKILDCRYIGRSKARGRGDLSALGWMNNQWAVVFPENILRKYFGEEDPTTEKTLYGVLNVSEKATPDEIKTGYRRLALQWHPDTCKEPNAHEVFLRIQETYNILSNPNKRARYDAGLAFEKQSSRNMDSYSPIKAVTTDPFGYRTPLRNGLILVEGNQSGKYFVVSKIHRWLDITDNAGHTLVSNWVYGEDKPQEKWL